MSDYLKPDTAAQVLDAVTWAVSSGTPLDVRGSGSKRSLGRATNVGHVLDLSALSGIIEHDPGELILEVKAGTAMAEIESLLAAANQMLAFEPPDLSALLNAADFDAGADMAGSLGGLVACNLAGPRRIKAGAARDHVLGFEAVSGRAEEFKSGGRVMKNVTGFDLSKLMTGSFGTLGVITTATIKVLPKPEKTRTVLLIGADAPTALRAMTAALNSPHEVSGAAHLTAEQAAAAGVDRVSGIDRAVTAVRVEGPASSVAARAAALSDLLSVDGPVDDLHSTNSIAFWKAVRDVAPFCGPDHKDDVVWRLSVPPADGADVAARLKAATGGDTLFDWGGGLLWHRMGASADGGHAAVRGVLGPNGGQALLVRASADVRAAVPVFHPEDPGLEIVSRRIKAGFDPEGILNPGRMLPVEAA